MLATGHYLLKGYDKAVLVLCYPDYVLADLVVFLCKNGDLNLWFSPGKGQLLGSACPRFRTMVPRFAYSGAVCLLIIIGGKRGPE